MSADILRRAASLMRERAAAATPGPWLSKRGPGEHVVTDVASVATVTSLRPREDRRHIASWDPSVAFMVADWLDEEADSWEPENDGITYYRPYLLAATYLGDAL